MIDDVGKLMMMAVTTMDRKQTGRLATRLIGDRPDIDIFYREEDPARLAEHFEGIDPHPYGLVIRRGTVLVSGRTPDRTDDQKPWPFRGGISVGGASGNVDGIAQKWFGLDVFTTLPYITPNNFTGRNVNVTMGELCTNLGFVTIFQVRKEFFVVNLGDVDIVTKILNRIQWQHDNPDRFEPVRRFRELHEAAGKPLPSIFSASRSAKKRHLLKIRRLVDMAFEIKPNNTVFRNSQYEEDGMIASYLCAMGYGGWLWPGSPQLSGEIMICQPEWLDSSENKIRYVGTVKADSKMMRKRITRFCDAPYSAVDSNLTPHLYMTE